MTARERVIAAATDAIQRAYPTHVLDFTSEQTLWLLICALADRIVEREGGFARRGAPGRGRIKAEPNTNATLVSGEEPR